ncbi:hypothetical protein F4808DRAFT_469733 [Astrocystis sublimbata]|nr:hypothetical protein F4808DRAFT_469733 [Astrocystis sublimbata]
MEVGEDSHLSLNLRARPASALARLCRTSARQRAIAQPILFHRIYSLNIPSDSSLGLLNALIARPYLAASVKQCLLTRRDLMIPFPLSHLMMKYIADKLGRRRSLCPDFFHCCVMRYFIHQVLSQVPNLESLRFDNIYCPPCHKKEHRDFFFCGPLPMLPALRQVRIDETEHQRRFDLSSMRGLFLAAQNVEILSVSNFHTSTRFLSLFSVTRLFLTCMQMNRATMVSILQHCRRLHTLVVDVRKSADSSRPQKIIDYLRTTGNNRTLQRLFFNFPRDRTVDNNIRTSLADFNQLRELLLPTVGIAWVAVSHTPYWAHTPVRQLPRSLERISIARIDNRNTLNAINQISHQVYGGLLPNLRKVFLSTGPLRGRLAMYVFADHRAVQTLVEHNVEYFRQCLEKLDPPWGLLEG